MTTSRRLDADRVLIFDTTLRDGEQSPGAAMTLQGKLQIAEMLDAMGVDVIEAGFPIASNGDFEAVSAVSNVVKNATVCGFARANPKDIARAGEALKNAARKRINVCLAVSPIHMERKLNLTSDATFELLVRSISQARNLTDDVEWIAEDGTRTEIEFLCRCVEAAIKAGATTITIPDTVGYTVPDQYRDLFKTLLLHATGAETIRFGVHCHDDLGLAVANSLAGVNGGARQVECTVNGLGERAGNASLEEVVMAMRIRNDALPYWTNIQATHFQRASRLVSAVSGFPIQYNKAIVGRNAFSHGSGIHQDGILKSEDTYVIIQPETVGVKETSFVMTKHSGRRAFVKKLEELGYKLGGNQLEDAFSRFKTLADCKKFVYDEDIEALIEEESSSSDRIKLLDVDARAGMRGRKPATVVLEVDGKELTAIAEGNGPVDATFNAIKKIVPHDARLDLYQQQALTEGTDAQVEIHVHLVDGEKTAAGRGADTDNVVASARAYIRALNKLLNGKGR